MKGRRQSRRANGDGCSIYWSMNRYVAQVTLGVVDGRLKRKKLYGRLGDDSRAAKVAVEERAAKYVGRRGKSDGSARLKEFIDLWIERAFVAGEIRAKTKGFYEWASRKHLGKIGSVPLIDLESHDVKAHLGTLDSMPRTKRAVYGLIHRVLQYAVEEEVLGQNVAANVRRPKVARSEQRALSPVEVSYLLKAAKGDRLEAVVVLSLTSTMGPGEMFGLRRCDVHLSERYLTVSHDLVEAKAHGYRPTLEAPKNPKRRRRIDLPQITVEALRERLKLCLAEGSGELVFTSPDGAPIRLSNLCRRWWKPLLLKAAELAKDAREAGDTDYRFPTGLRMYALRHTAASLMGHVGVPIEVARERMGHSSIRTTVDVYGHCYEGTGRSVADKLDDFFGQ